MIRIGIIEDNFFLLKNYQEFLKEMGHYEIVFACTTLEEAFRNRSVEKGPDIILLDLFLPGMQGNEGIDQLRKKYPESRILILTSHNKEDLILDCLKKGARGYILKNTGLFQMHQSILETMEDGVVLSPQVAQKFINSIFARSSRLKNLSEREQQIIELLFEGYSYVDIGKKLFISTNTVNHHLKIIYRKFNVNSRSQLNALLNTPDEPVSKQGAGE